MRKLIVTALVLASISAPAAAQYRSGYDNRGRSGGGIERQIDQIEQQIDRLRDRRLISTNEARRLSRQAEQLDRLHDRYRRDGLSQRERADLQHRVQALRSRVQSERQEGRHDRRR